jgi:hypothetical protein
MKMQLKGLFKRVVPFFLTFALGLLVASFFVTVAAPSFNFKDGKRKAARKQRNASPPVGRKRDQSGLRETVVRRRFGAAAAADDARRQINYIVKL